MKTFLQRIAETHVRIGDVFVLVVTIVLCLWGATDFQAPLHAQKPEKPASGPAAPPGREATLTAGEAFKPTVAQHYRMEAAQQEFFRWTDKVNEAAQKFGQACQAAQEENHWPDIVCHIDTLQVTPKNQPPPEAAPIPAATPPAAVPPPPAAKK